MIRGTVWWPIWPSIYDQLGNMPNLGAMVGRGVARISRLGTEVLRLRHKFPLWLGAPACSALGSKWILPKNGLDPPGSLEFHAYHKLAHILVFHKSILLAQAIGWWELQLNKLSKNRIEQFIQYCNKTIQTNICFSAENKWSIYKPNLAKTKTFGRSWPL